MEHLPWDVERTVMADAGSGLRNQLVARLPQSRLVARLGRWRQRTLDRSYPFDQT